MVWHPTRRPETVDQNRLSHRAAKPGQPSRQRGQPIPASPTAAERLAAVQASKPRRGDNDTQGEKTMNDPLIALSVLALELSSTAAELATRLDIPGS